MSEEFLFEDRLAEGAMRDPRRPAAAFQQNKIELCPGGQIGKGASFRPRRFCGFDSHPGHQKIAGLAELEDALASKPSEKS